MSERIINIDGSLGEGGGQVLRTSISLSAITGKPVRIDNIRAGRKKPGLMRQHLTSIKAAAEICGAETENLQLGATEISFHPGKIKGGDYLFEIGSAGGTVLVAQTIIPILSHADKPSNVIITGGTHNMWAPTFDYLERAFLPLFNKMGGQVSVELSKYGFYPAGGGEIVLAVKPVVSPKPFKLVDRGDRLGERVVAVVANLKSDIAKRELKTVAGALNLQPEQCEIIDVDGPGPGNIVTLFLEYENITEVFVGIGQYGVRAETLASKMASAAKKFIIAQDAAGNCYTATDEHLADQLLLPISLFGGGVFTTTNITGHTLTNIDIIRRFLGVDIMVSQTGRKCWAVEVKV